MLTLLATGNELTPSAASNWLTYCVGLGLRGKNEDQESCRHTYQATSPLQPSSEAFRHLRFHQIPPSILSGRWVNNLPGEAASPILAGQRRDADHHCSVR
jgi:hypothetical protein